MANYERILVAVDLTDESSQVLQRAVAVAQQNGAQLSLLHVIENLNFPAGGDVPIDLSSIQEEIDQQAHKRIEEMAASIDYPIAKSVITTGNTEREIHEIAQSMDSDLIVIGSHGRHGLALLLGSTSNSVLHGATCDILAVRLKSV